MNETSSFVTVPKSVALELASAKLAWIIQYRQDRRREYLAREVQEANRPTFWKKLFRTPPVTEQDIIDREESAEFIWENELAQIQSRFSSLENLCWAVQSACRIGDDSGIHLTLDDAERLQ